MNTRKQKGMKITQDNDSIIRIEPDHYQVRSQSTDKHYVVIATESGFSCSCPDHHFRKACCKHIHAVEISLELRKKVEQQITISPVTSQSCPKCNSNLIVKHGIRHNKYADIQRFSCKDCNTRFSINLGFEKMRTSPQVITSAMQLYFTGESLRNVQKFLELQGVKITHNTVWNWIKKYVNLMESYLDQIVPKVGDKWRADELFLKVKGDTKYLYALMDDETRFWIAKQVSGNKYKDNIQQMFRDGKTLTQKKPKVLITDGAKNFHQAYKKEFSSWRYPRTTHIQHIHFKGDRNNNKMERLNGELRDREKVMRSLKKDDSPIITGMQIHHNFIRTHMGIDNYTPAEKAGIKVEGNNKWITLIQNASNN